MQYLQQDSPELRKRKLREMPFSASVQKPHPNWHRPNWKNLALCAFLPIGFALLLISYIMMLAPSQSLSGRKLEVSP